jgi:hypothetical protein
LAARARAASVSPRASRFWISAILASAWAAVLTDPFALDAAGAAERAACFIIFLSVRSTLRAVCGAMGMVPCSGIEHSHGGPARRERPPTGRRAWRPQDTNHVIDPIGTGNVADG